MLKNIRSQYSILLIARIISMLYAAFFAIFALDVFESNDNFWQILMELCLHLIPSFIILLVMWVSWKRSWIGAILYLLLALCYITISLKRLNWSACVMIAGPLFVISALYFYVTIYKSQN